jgi:hypothetical protein
MNLIINFTADVAARCLQELNYAGYAVATSDDEDAIYTYTSIRHRRVRRRPRTIHKATYIVPPHLVAGEAQLCSKVASGGDLWPHQSRKIVNLAVEDGMLNDYGIQHFHLGITPDPRHSGLIAGTKELLFAIVKEDDFYAIGIYDHKAWTKKAVLDVVHSTWPQVTETFTLKGVVGLSHSYTDAEAKKLRAARINVLQQRPDGAVQMGMGGGVAADGSSLAVRRETDRLLDHIEDLQETVRTLLEPYVADGRLPEDAPVRVVWQNNDIYAVPDPAVVKCDLTGRLIIPPL